MTIKFSRRAAALVGASLAVGSLSFVGATSGAVAAETPATTTYSKALSYRCDVAVNYLGSDLVLPGFPVVANVSFDLPKLTPYLDLDATNIKIGLKLDETLRDATTGLLSGVAADGVSKNTYLFVDTTQGDRRVYDIPELSAGKSDIPLTAGTPWVIAASGAAPKITVPSTSAVTISGPEKFNIDATIYQLIDDDFNDETPKVPGQQKVGLACHSNTDRRVATIPVGEKTTVTPRLPASIKARTASSFRTEVRGATSTPTGQVFAYLENGQPVSTEGEFAYTYLNKNGDVRIPLPKFGKLGKRTLKIVYQGDDKHGSITLYKSFTVTR